MINKKLNEDRENKSVSDEELMGLFDAACKTEAQVINLVVASVKFANPDIKRSVVALKSQASQLTTLIAQTMESSQGINLGVSNDDGVSDIEANPPANELLGSDDAESGLIENKRTKITANSIDLSEHFSSFQEGKLTFDKFKNDVYSSLLPAIRSNELKEASNPEAFNKVMDKVYDVADAINLEIKTV